MLSSIDTEIRPPANIEELTAIQRLRHEVLDPARALHDIDARLTDADTNPANFHLAAFIGSVPVSALRCDSLGWGMLEIVKVATSPDHQRQGNGTRLMKAAEKKAIQRGAHVLLVSPRLGEVQDFYSRLGFTPITMPFNSRDGVKKLWMEKHVGNINE